MLTVRLLPLAAVVLLLVLPESAPGNTTSVTITESTGRYIGAAVGRAFEDVDDDGRFRRGLDKPLAAIAVTDGYGWTESDADGQFKLPLRLESRAVTAARPPGYWPSTTWCRPIFPSDPNQKFATAEQFLAAASPGPINFAFRKAKVDDTGSFNALIAFGQSPGHDLATAPVGPPPDFRLLFQNNPEALAPDPATTLSEEASRVFVFDDLTSPALRFAIDFDRYRFIVANSLADPGFRNWLETHPKLTKDTQLVIATPTSPGLVDLEWLNRFNILAVVEQRDEFSRLSRVKGGRASIISLPSCEAGAPDGTPAGYRILQFNGQQFNTLFRPLSTFNKPTVAAPGLALAPADPRLVINLASALDGPLTGRFKLQAGSTVFFEGPLKQVAPWTWMAPLAPAALGLPTLPQQFDVAVRLKGTHSLWESTTKGFAPVTAAPVTLGADWMQYMNTAQHSGFTPAGGPAAPLTLAWVTPTHGAIFAGGPVLYRGTLAVGVRDPDNMIANGVALIDAVSGKMKQFVKTDEAVAHAAAFAEDTVDGPGIIYAQSTAGTVYRISPADGKLMDKSESPRQGLQPVLAAPAVQGKLAITGGASYTEGFSAQYAERRWSSREAPSALTVSPASLAGPEIVITNSSPVGPSILGLSAQSGRKTWEISAGGVAGSVLTIPGIGYTVTRGGSLLKLNLKDATVATSMSISTGGSAATPATDGRRLFVPAEGTLTCLDRNTLEELWRFRPEKSLWPVAFGGGDSALFSSPAVAGNRIYIGSSDGRLYMLNSETGTTLWHHDFGVPLLAAPCVSGNGVFVAAADGNVYAFTGAGATAP